jgi:hypothetical protein
MGMTADQITAVRNLLLKAHEILRTHGETHWIGGIEAAMSFGSTSIDDADTRTNFTPRRG